MARYLGNGETYRRPAQKIVVSSRVCYLCTAHDHDNGIIAPAGLRSGLPLNLSWRNPPLTAVPAGFGFAELGRVEESDSVLTWLPWRSSVRWVSAICLFKSDQNLELGWAASPPSPASLIRILIPTPNMVYRPLNLTDAFRYQLSCLLFFLCHAVLLVESTPPTLRGFYRSGSLRESSSLLDLLIN